MSTRTLNSTQSSFLPNQFGNTRFGGGTRSGKRKLARPVSLRQSMHVTLRASRAIGKLSMGNHIHLLLRASTRAGFQAFLRAATGQIAMLVTGAKKGASKREEGKTRSFWDELAFSRIVHWGKDREGALRYFSKNLLESFRMIRNGEVVGYAPELWEEFAHWMGLPAG